MAEEAPVILSPSAGLMPLTDAQRDALRAVGERWDGAMADEAAWRKLPVDPTPAEVEAPEARGATRIRRLTVGPPLATSALVAERMRKLVALPVLASDALSSVAYGPEAMLAVLVLAGTAGLDLALPIAGAVVVLMLAVGLSYRQTIRAYPRGGGSYIVASDNLGPPGGLVAAAGLMTDYVLTVAVSVSAGVAAVTSAVPEINDAKLELALAVVALLLAGNLRGIRQAGALFALPTYLFIAAMALVIGVGLVDAAGNGFEREPPPPVPVLESVGLLLVLRAFGSGATAMTGIEAISDGIPAFKQVEWRNARTTLTVMITLLVTMFVGVTLLLHLNGIIPSSDQTALSQLARGELGDGALYGYVQAATALVLLLAANTSFSDFPRLLFFLSRDRYAPMQFRRLGDRLAFSNGILVLSIAAAILLILLDADTSALIPLYAIGVFLAFTLSQTGMVVHWLRKRSDGWKKAIPFNIVGAILSAIVLLITAATKFTEGAWMVVILIPVIVAACAGVHRHYLRVAEEIAVEPEAEHPPPRHPLRPAAPSASPVDVTPETEQVPGETAQLCVVPLTDLHRPGLRALAYAVSLRLPTVAVHLAFDDEDEARFRDVWAAWGDHVPLEVIRSPYRALSAPLAEYLAGLHAQRSDLELTVVIPQVVPLHTWEVLLHDQTASRIRRALRRQPGTVVTSVPFHLSR